MPTAHLPTKAADIECSCSKGMVTCAVGWRDRAAQACWRPVVAMMLDFQLPDMELQIWYLPCWGSVLLWSAFPCYLSSRNERYSVLLYTKNIGLFFCITGTQSQEFISRTALGMWICEDARSWAECILHYEMAASLRKPSMNVLVWAYVFQDSVPSRGSVLESCRTFRSSA